MTKERNKLNQAIAPKSKGSEEPFGEDLAELRAALRRRLQPQVEKQEILWEVYQTLIMPDRKPQTREQVAADLADHLAAKWRFVPVTDFSIERLIENRPKELDAVVRASNWDEIAALANSIIHLPPRRKARAKPRSDEERRENIRLAKSGHERVRSHKTTTRGLIEREFSGEPQRSVFEMVTGKDPFDDLPGGPCLDDVFRGGGIRISQGSNSLEDLFGRSRKMLPTALVRRRVGREFLYGHQAVLQCIDALLEGTNGRAPWPSYPLYRKLILLRILIRAYTLAKPEIADDFDKAFQKRLD